MTKKEIERIIIELEAERFRVLFSEIIDYLDNDSYHILPIFLSRYIKGRAIELGLFRITSQYGINPDLEYIRERKNKIKELENKLKSNSEEKIEPICKTTL